MRIPSQKRISIELLYSSERIILAKVTMIKTLTEKRSYVEITNDGKTCNDTCLDQLKNVPLRYDIWPVQKFPENNCTGDSKKRS